MAFIEGYIIGFLFIVFIGPVMFTLIQATLQWGYKSGLAVALGILTSDIIAILLCAFGAAKLFQDKEVQLYIGIGGAVVLTAMGLKYLLAPPYPKEIEIEPGNKDLLGAYVKGFLVNGVNPFVFIVWIGVIGEYGALKGYGSDLAIFLLGAIIAIFINDAAKVFLAHKIKPLLKPEILIKVYRGVGALLIFGAIYLIYQTLILTGYLNQL